jgi:flavodoxin
MKKHISIVLMFTLMAALTGCGSSTQAQTTDTQAVAEAQEETAETPEAEDPETEQAETAQQTDEAAVSETEAEPEGKDPVPAEHSDVLVAYFSATGTTKGVAERIASVTGGDLYQILAAEPYTEDDLNYNDDSSRSTVEQNDKSVRPEIGSEEISLDGYTTIYLGFPIWWGEEPRILDTFVEKYNFEGITVIPFCTSGGSGIGRSGSNMESLAGAGTWLEGQRFSGNVSEEELQSWIEGL